MAPGKKSYSAMDLADPSRAARQAKLNKDRGNRMEREVATYLSRNRDLISRRTPMSGAGWLKGDNHVPLPYPPDFFIISCKTSEAVDKEGPFIRFQNHWLHELDRDFNGMRSIGCKFGVIVLKYHGRRKGELFTFIPEKHYDALMIQLGIDVRAIECTALTAGYQKNGKPNNSFKIHRSTMVAESVYRWKTPITELLSIPLEVIYESLLQQDAYAKSETTQSEKG